MNASTLKYLQRVLIEPSHSYDVATLHKSRLLSASLLVMIFIFAGLDTTSVLTVPGYVVPWYGYVFLLAAYMLNRGRYYKISAGLVVLMFPVVIFSAILRGEANTPAVSLGFLVLGLIVGSILLPQAGVALLAVGNVIGILSLPRLVPQTFPDLDSIITPLAVFAIGAALLLISMRHRDQVEKDRQRELRDSEAQYRMLFDESPTGIFIADLNTTILMANPAACEMLGYSMEELVGKDAASLIEPGDLIRQPIRLREEVQLGRPIRRERPYIRKDGALVSVLGSFKQMPDGQVLYIFQDISDRKRAEEALHMAHDSLEQQVQERTVALSQANALLQTLMDNVPDHIFFKDVQGHFIRTSKSQAKMLGLNNPAEVVGKSDFDFFSHAQRAYDDEQKVMRTGQPLVDFEENVIWPDGRETWVSTTKVPLRDRGDQIIGTFGIARDITERKRAEDALRKAKDELEVRVAERTSELNTANEQLLLELNERRQAEAALAVERDLLQALMNNIPDTIYFKDTASRFTRINRAQAKVLGLAAPEEAIDKTDLDFQEPDLAKSFYEEEQRLVENGESLINRIEFNPTKDGQPRWFSATKVPLRDENGRVTGIVGISRDITERKQAEEALRKNEEKFRQLITSAPDAIIGADQEGRIMFANLEATKLLGYELEELLGMDVDMLVPTRFRAAHIAKYAGYMANPHPRMRAGLELFATRKNGSEVPVDISLSRLDTDAGILVTAFIRDVTARKEAEQSLREAEEKYRTLVEQLPAMTYIFRFSEDSAQPVFISPQVETFLGYSQAEWLNDSELWAETLHSDDLERVIVELQRMVNHGDPLDVEYRVVTRDNQIKWFHNQAARIFDTDREYRFVHGVVFDITERMRAEASLRESEERFRKIFHSSPIAICITTLEKGRLLDGNHAYWELSGYDPKTDVGRNYIELKLWDDPSERVQFVEEIRQKRSIHNPNYEFLDTKGNQKSAIAFYEIIQLGEEECVLSMFYDMSAQKATVQALAESEERYRLISNLSTDYVFSSKVHKDGSITHEWQVGAFEAISGYTPEEIRQRGWRETVHPDDLVIDDYLLEKLRSNQKASADMRVITKSGETRWIREYAYPVWNDTENRLVGIYGAVQNIHEQKLAEEEIQQLNAELEDRVTERTAQLHEANQNLHQEKVRLEQYNRQRELMADMTDLLQASLTTDEASSIVSSHMQLLFPNRDGALYLLNASGSLEPIAIWGEQKSMDTVFGMNDCWALRRGKPYRFGSRSPNPPCVHMGKEIPQSALCIPLSGQMENLGSLHISQSVREAGLIDDEEQRFIETIADSVALALANLRLRERLRIQSIRDGLTGLFNRRYLDETLPREIHRAERGKYPISVLMFDIDHFKKFNDTYGHDAGDIVLRRIAELILSKIRPSDIACRYGGEEFTIILPDTPLETAHTRAESLREAASQMEVQHNGKDLGKITISLGVAAYPQHGMNRDNLIKAADEAAYQAKGGGRNRIVLATTKQNQL